MVHGGRYAELAPVLAELITDLEINIRQEISEEDALEARRLLADAYQAAAAALAKIGDGDAAWIAADRAAFVSESIGSPLALSASLFRMAHVFLGLGMISQVQKVATGAMSALGDLIIMPSDTIRIKDNADIEAVSLYGAFNLILAVAAAHENQRSEARSHLDTARAVASYVGDGRNDFGTEFGPTNVALHAVSVAVELGDAGEALDLSRQVNTATLSPERQARYLIDLAAAYSMRRQIGDAIRCLTEADKLTPEQTRTHRVARDVTRELLQLSGVRVRPELRDLADRFGLT
jgi:tetratricopeptide (TPR) repeat protein